MTILEDHAPLAGKPIPGAGGGGISGNGSSGDGGGGDLETSGGGVGMGPQAAWLAELEGALAGFDGVVARRAGVVGTLRAADLSRVLGLLDGVGRKIEVVRAEVLALSQERGEWKAKGFRSLAEWRNATTKQGFAASQREARLAETLVKVPAAKDALEAGDITTEHAVVLTRFAGEGDREARDQALQAGLGTQLVESAKRLDAADLAKRAKNVGRQVDADELDGTIERARAKRYLRLRQQAGGVYGEFFLDEVAGEEVRTALESRVRKLSMDDQRTYEQQRADALVSLARESLNEARSKSGARVKPHISIHVNEATFLAYQHPQAPPPTRPRTGPRASATTGTNSGAADSTVDAGTATSSGDAGAVAELSSAGGVSGSVEADAALAALIRLRRTGQLPPARFDDGTIIPAQELARLMCGAHLTRIVFDEQGAPINAGRTVRTVTGEMHRAVVARDQHCMWPHCTKPPEWCDDHHIVEWEDGGDTDIDNIVLLCDGHHDGSIHRDGASVIPIPDGFEFRRADGTLIGRTYYRALTLDNT